MTRHNAENGIRLYNRGRRVKGERPAKPEKPRKPVEIDREALAEVLSTPAPEPPRETRGANHLPATGLCHQCDRPVSGERRFCGPCLAKRI